MLTRQIVLSVLAELFWTYSPQIYSKVLANVIKMTECSKCYKNVNTSCLPKKPRQAAHMNYDRLHQGLQIYGWPGSLSHDFKIWPITFQGSGPS